MNERRPVSASPPHPWLAPRPGARDSRLLVHVASRPARIPTDLSAVRRGPVAGRIVLDAPSFFERAGVHDVEAELVDEATDRCLRARHLAAHGYGCR